MESAELGETASTRILLAQRYRVQRRLGRGGFAETFEVFDEREQRPLALKLFSPKGAATSRDLQQALFRREYSILAQFAHPHVVRVHEFGLDQSTPFFTMDLISGQHPGVNGPLPWREVCRMLVALCEPLMLLHSRGWVHRDVSPRNVFLCDDGQIKLIDFSTVAALDAQHRAIGTPTGMAPETFRHERLDARTDLFGLGALAYYALTAKHAYPARVLTQLPLLWQTPPLKPSELVSEIPGALDQLVLSLLSLGMDGRPRQVAEVIARLLAVAELPVDNHPSLGHASLITPELIGRERELEQLREVLHWSEGGRSAACLVRGPRGSGCSRLLDTLALEATLHGHGVARANASVCGNTSFALVRDLCRTVWNGAAEQAKATGHTLESALALFDANADEAAQVAGQRAFVSWCELWSKTQSLLLLVDEADELDAASARLLAQLARRGSSLRLTMVFTLHGHQPLQGALQAILRDATTIDLKPLEPQAVERLFQALFGDVPNLTGVAAWCQRTTNGQPGACLAAARSLVESGRAKFADGSWQLPRLLSDPPPSADARVAFDRMLDKLSPLASDLLQLLASVTQPPPFDTARYGRALQQPDAAVVIAEGELLAHHAFVANGQGYAVHKKELLTRVRERMTPAQQQACHLLLAKFYIASRQDLCAAFHLWRASRWNEADALLTSAVSVTGAVICQDTSQFGLSGNAAALFEALLTRRKQRNAAPSELYPLRMALLSSASSYDIALLRYADETIDQLRIDTGIDLWEGDFAKGRSDEIRMRSCLAEAKRRHDATDEDKRGLPPTAAASVIFSCAGILTGLYATQYDVAGARRIAALCAPLRSISPLLEIASNMAQQCALAVIDGNDVRPLRARVIAATREKLPNISLPLRDGIHYITSYYLAMDDAVEGRDSALEIAARLEVLPACEALGLQIRRMHALAHGRFEEAQQYRRARELLSFQSTSADNHLQLSLLRELGAAYECRDLLEVTRYTTAVRERAALYPGLRPWAALGQAECHLLADEPTAAREVVEQALQNLEPFSHGAYYHLILAKATAHNDLREHAEAKRLMLELFAQADERTVHMPKLCLLQATLAVAEAGSGDREGALARLDELLARTASELGDNTVLYGRLCEARCQAACIVKDYSGFAKNLERMEPIYAAHPSLRARHARWVRAGKDRFQKLLALLTQADAGASWATRIAAAMTSHSSEHQGEYLLSIVLDEIAVDVGQLFRIDDTHTMRLMAARPARPDPLLLVAAERCLAAWSSSDDMQTADDGGTEPDLSDSQGRTHVPLWLTKSAQPDELTGLVLVACSSSRLGELTPAFVRAISQHLESLAR